MKVKFIITALIAVFLGSFSAFAQEKEIDVEEICEKEADRLESLLELEAWQTFRVDSTLKHDYPAMKAEIADLQAAKVSNVTMYQQVQDKWMDKIDESYKKILTPEQWDYYMKQGAAKAQKARDKRRAKLEQSAVAKKK